MQVGIQTHPRLVLEILNAAHKIPGGSAGCSDCEPGEIAATGASSSCSLASSPGGLRVFYFLCGSSSDVAYRVVALGCVVCLAGLDIFKKRRRA